MSTLVEQLRQPSGNNSIDEERRKAAWEIERLHAIVDRLPSSDESDRVWNPVANELRARAQDYREPDSIGPFLAECAEEIEWLQNERDEARVVAVNLYRFLSLHETVPKIDEQYGWLIEAVKKVGVRK